MALRKVTQTLKCRTDLILQFRKEIISILNYWLDKGVDGFRFDVFNMFSKVYPIRDDNSKDSFQRGAPYYVD